MARVFRLSLLLLAFIVLVGCSSKASRRDDRPGVGPMITLAAKFPPGHYASVIDASIGTTIRAQGRPGPTVNLVMCMETALDVRQSGDRKTASVSFTRVKADCNGVRADTDTPLPPQPAPNKGFSIPDFSRNSNRPDPSQVLRKALGQMIGPRIEWVILTDGGVGDILINEFPGAFTDANLAAAMKDNLDPHNLAESFSSSYPSQPVAVGAIWHVNRERQLFGAPERLPVETEFELIAVEDSPAGKIATIKYVCNFSRQLNGTSSNITIRSLSMTLEGTNHVAVDSGLQLDGIGTMAASFTGQSQGKDVDGTVKMKMNYSAKPQP